MQGSNLNQAVIPQKVEGAIPKATDDRGRHRFETHIEPFADEEPVKSKRQRRHKGGVNGTILFVWFQNGLVVQIQ